MKGFPFGFTGLVLAAAVFGIVGVLLMMASPWGLNFTLWFGTILVVALWNATRPGVRADSVQRAALIGALVFTILFSWRDFQIEFFLIILLSIALASETALGRMMRLPLTPEDARSDADSMLCQGPAESDRNFRVQRRIVRAFLVIVPAIFLSGWYLFENNPSTRRWVERVTAPQWVEWIANPANAMTQIIWCAVYAWVAVVVWRICPNLDVRRRVKLGFMDYLARLGAIGIGIAMLGAALPDFMVSQLYWLTRTYYRAIHGAELNESWFDLAHAASRGADDLLWVVMVSFIALIYSARALRHSRVWIRRIFNVLSGLVVLGLVLVLAAALDRLIAYISVGGLTRTRLHAAILFGATIAVFLGLYLAILRERVRAFAWGFLWSSYGLVVVLTAINSDAIVVRTNVQGAFYRDLDTEYLGWLGVDAVPALLDSLPHVKDPKDRSRLNYLVQQYNSMTESRNWRGWTFGWYQARAALKEFDFSRYESEEPRNP